MMVTSVGGFLSPREKELRKQGVQRNRALQRTENKSPEAVLPPSGEDADVLGLISADAVPCHRPPSSFRQRTPEA